MISLRKLYEDIKKENIPSVLLDRIPFFKDYSIGKNTPDRLELQRIIFNENVKVIMKDNILNFDQYNVNSEFIYYIQKVDQNTFYNFILKTEFPVTKPKEMDDLEYRVFILAKKQLEHKLSYNKEIMVKGDNIIPSDIMDDVINNINGKLFEIEQFTEKHNIKFF